jgi:hypothetical protein
LAALAAEPQQQAPAPPPPDMDAPAVKAVPVEKSAAGSEAKPVDQATATDANGEPAPVVSVRKQGDDTVEEYRRDGRITMIRITGKAGVAQTYIANGDGKLVRDARQGPVDPVYFTVYQWK